MERGSAGRRECGTLLTRHAVELGEPYVWDLIGNVVPFQGDGVGDFRTQGGAARLRRCALPRADMLRPLRA
ncbi:MAG: hypothetical protein QGG36_20660, partial [Pirellulaceae bacterium]|nr:hypothetical protein [Pirellulaceae bacterium]